MSHNRVKELNGAAVTASGSRGGAVSGSQPEQANEFQCVYMCDCAVVQPVTTWGCGVVARETRWFAEFRLKNILIGGNSRTISRIFKGQQRKHFILDLS